MIFPHLHLEIITCLWRMTTLLCLWIIERIQVIELVPRISRTLTDKWVLKYKQSAQTYCISIYQDTPFDNVDFFIRRRECVIMFSIVCNFCFINVYEFLGEEYSENESLDTSRALYTKRTFWQFCSFFEAVSSKIHSTIRRQFITLRGCVENMALLKGESTFIT